MQANRLILIAALVACASCARGPQSPQFDFEAQPRAVLQGVAKSSAGPQMFFTSSGHLYVLAGGPSGLNVYVSENGGDTFGERIPVAPASAQAMTMGEMSPIMLQDTAGPSMDVLYESGNGGLYFAKAYLFAKRFPKAISLVRKRVPSENGFATMALAPNGAIYVAWLDGRASDRNAPNTFSLYVARSVDHGRTFQTPVRVARGACPCCRPAFAFGADGTVYVAWRTVYPGNFRDVVVSSSRDGRSFAPALRVSRDGWSLDGCPDSGPALETAGKRLYVAWYTEGSSATPQIRVAHTDDMRAFSPAVTVPGGVLDANHPKFVANAPEPTIVFQARAPGADRWKPVTAFLARIDGDAISPPQALPAPPVSLTDPVARMRDAHAIYVAATEQAPAGPQVLLLRGRSR